MRWFPRSVWPPLFLFFGVSLVNASASDRKDILVLKNGDRLTGEIRQMNSGILDFKCDYGDNHFKIYWDQIKYLESKETVSIELSDGERFLGTLEKKTGDSDVLVVRDQSGALEEVALLEIAYLHKGVSFSGRLDGSLDVGYSLTRSSNTQQLTVGGTLVYDTQKWTSFSSGDALFSSKSGTEDTERYSIDSGLRRLIRNNWFVVGGVDFLVSNELEIDLRSVFLGGVGRYLRRDSNHSFVAVVGGAWNNENYSDPEIPVQNTPELMGSVTLNMFNLLGNDLNLFSQLNAFKSLTEGNRTRFDLDLELRWSLPKHWYFNLSFTDNYDSSPIGDTPTNDFVFSTGFGWSP